MVGVERTGVVGVDVLINGGGVVGCDERQSGDYTQAQALVAQ